MITIGYLLLLPRVVLLIRLVSPFFVPLVLLTLSGGVSAIGLGELRGQAVLGDRLWLEVDLLGAEKLVLDPACFRLVQPSASGDIPWLRQASFSIRKAAKPVLQIRSEAPLREPILQLAVEIGCGHDVARDYMVLASPESFNLSLPVAQTPSARNTLAETDVLPRSKESKVRPALSQLPAAMPRLALQPKIKRPVAPRQSDQILLSSGIDASEPMLRLAPELSSWGGGVKEAQRDILRLEYRMLAALHEQVVTQMATAEKLRNMEATLGELQQLTSEFAQRVEPVVPPVSPPAPRVDLPVADVKAPPTHPPERAPVKTESFSLTEWSIYGALLGALLGIGGWLGWRRYHERQEWLAEDEELSEFPESEVDAPRNDECEEQGGVDLPVEPTEMGSPMQVDLELDGGQPGFLEEAGAPNIKAIHTHDSLMSISATTVDEHFEANPVMELADIMLSFGRVKGAAQALQEYIEHSPQEALQPWIRLLEVYRMAEMRTEFELLATNLNQNFNVAIPSWEQEQPKMGGAAVDLVLDGAVAAQSVALPQSIEDMPRIISTVCELWSSGDVVAYLQQLLRDNRGGKRVGFALPVVEEILFLVELKECANRIE